MSRRTLGAWMQGPLDVVHEHTVEVAVIESGTLHVRLGDACGVQGPGQVAIIPPHVRHGCWTEASTVVEVVVHLDAAGLAALVEGDLQAGVWAADGVPAVTSLGPAVTGDPQAVPALALALVACTRGRTGLGVTHDARIVRAVEAIGARLDRAWTVGALAKVAGLSEAHFTRRFRDATGSPPMRYVQDQRLSRAQWLMQCSEDSLTDIALRVGFGSPSRFTEAFARRHGVLPSVWRSPRR